MDDTSALPVVATKPRPRQASVVGGLGVLAVCTWGAAIYMTVAGRHSLGATLITSGLAVTVSLCTAVAWAVWHLRSKGSLEHRVMLAKVQDLETKLSGLLAGVAGLRQDFTAGVRQARADGYVDAAHDFGINPPTGGDEPPRNTRGAAFLRPVPGGRGDVG